ncbi:hypothetical protein SIPHO019v1_50002, partial [Vibrio phage 82E32.1]
MTLSLCHAFRPPNPSPANLVTHTDKRRHVMQTLNTDVDSIGGGFGGMGGFGNNPLLWLITLGFLKGDSGLFGGNGNAGAGVLAGETQAKLDCLAQGQDVIRAQAA